jgi:hypothetical protein
MAGQISLKKLDKERKLSTKVFCVPGKVLLQGGAGQHFLLLFYDVLHFLLLQLLPSKENVKTSKTRVLGQLLFLQ